MDKDKKYAIATGLSRKTKTWKNTLVTWGELVEKLSETRRTAETQDEYKALPKSRQDEIKDVGGFVAGHLKNGQRGTGKVECRSMITLDADFAEPDFCDTVEMFAEYSYIIYSTHKHTPEKPRLRLIVPLSRTVTAEEYEAAARKLADSIGIEQFDDTTYQPHRLMYFPSTSADGEYVFRHAERQPLDVDKLLAEYADWKDVREWAFSSRTAGAREKAVGKQEDPTAKKGVVGAFCRCYDVPAAIAEFLPDVYTPCAVGTNGGSCRRYTYAAGSTAAGLVIYDGGKFAYSNHATDPAGGTLCNAFDLVRIHLFGDKDCEAKEGTPTAKMPSFLAMAEFARADKSVKLRLFEEKTGEAVDDFADLLGVEVESEKCDSKHWALQLQTGTKGEYLATIDNVVLILQNDSELRGRLGFNSFTGRYTVAAALPWNESTSERTWSDEDDAGLRHFLEKKYGIKSKGNIDDARVLVSRENIYHPVIEYLDGLTWDKVPRAETLLIDYMGAEDTPYTRAVTRKTLAAAVRRVRQPGVKFDNVLIMVGRQGCGKSYLVSRLGGKWFSDTLTNIQGKEAYEELQGFWIVEIAELSALRKSEVEAVKHFIAKQSDSYRAAYDRHVKTRARQCIFFGTTNNAEFLRDATGNRRFLPVDVDPAKARLSVFDDLTDEVRDQIWAEACVIEAGTKDRAGEKLYLDTKELRRAAEAEQDRHFEQSPLTGDVERYLETPLPENWAELDLTDRRAYLHAGEDFGTEPHGKVRREKVCAMEIWCEMLCGDKKDLTTSRSKEISDIILKTGKWEKAKSNMTFGALYGSQRGFKRIKNQ
jgi:predicted P-loop ATPase